MGKNHVAQAPAGQGSRTQLLAALDTAAGGLSSDEAARRLSSHGPNRLDDRPQRSALADFLRRFRNPLILILLGAAAASALTSEQASFVIIVAMVLMSVTLDYVQEHRALVAADRLRERVALRVNAVRDGQPRDIPAAELVPGDVIVLQAGSLVPADARLLQAKDLFVNEALLTGEAFPCEKNAGDDGNAAPEGRAVPANVVLMGSAVISGTATAVVFATGPATRLGDIAKALLRAPAPSALARGVNRFGLLILRLTVFLVLLFLFVNLLLHRPVLEAFLFSLALAVGLTPELLPMILTVTLARGAMRMANKGVIVKRLAAIHDLGSMDVLCSDKTGTLTQGRISLARHVDVAGNDCQDVLQWAHVNSHFESGLTSPLDRAILEARTAGSEGWRKVDEVPFDFERRRVSVLAEQEGRRYLIVKGAPEDLLAISSRYRTAGNPADQLLGDDTRAVATATLQRLSMEGFRVLGVAWREVEREREHAGVADENTLTFAGFAAFFDPPKEGARQTLETLSRLGVKVKIVTGDNEWVTRHVAQALGLSTASVINGPDLERSTDEALAARLADATLFCRVNPGQKARIIRLLKARGHVVGYIGDGINDASSLHAADVGLSVEGAADVAREAAAMIMLEHDLGVLTEGVLEGRRTAANVMKYVMMGTSSNFGNMASMAGAALILPFLPMLPIQILLNNLLYDTSELAIPIDNVDDAMTARPARWDLDYVKRFMLVLGSVSSVFDFAMFGVLLWVFQADEATFRTAWFVESMMTQILVVFVVRTQAHPWASRPHPALLACSLGIVAIAVALPYTAVGSWFGFVPLPSHMLAGIVVITLAYLGVAEQTKQRFFAARGGPGFQRRPR